MKKEPLIKVAKGGDDFTMVDCEVVSGNRPALETEAKNTRLVRTDLLIETKQKPTTEIKKRWFSMNNPIVYIIVFLFIAGIAYLAYKLEWPLKFGSN